MLPQHILGGFVLGADPRGPRMYRAGWAQAHVRRSASLELFGAVLGARMSGSRLAPSLLL